MINSKELALDIANWAYDHKASKIEILEIEQVSLIADYFVIMHANNRSLTMALADYIGDEVEAKYQLPPTHKEGQQSGEWLLLDFGTVIVHIFLEEIRQFYDIERLWIDAPRLAFVPSQN